MSFSDEKTNLRAPSGGGLWYYGWNILAATFVYQAVIFGLTFYCFTFWVNEWMAVFTVDRSDVLLITMAMQVLIAICAPFTGRALDRYDIRSLIIVGILCYAGGMALVGLAESLVMIGVIYATLIALGVLWAGPFSAQLLMTKWFVAKRGMALGLAAAGTSFGGFVLPPFVTWLNTSHGWRDTHLILAALIVLLLVPIVLLVVRGKPQDVGLSAAISDTGAIQTTGRGGDIASEQIWTVGGILRERSFWITAVGLLPIILSFGSFSQNLAPLATDLGIDTQKTALLVSTMALCMVCGKVFFGACGDYLDHRWLVMMAQFPAVLAFSLLILLHPSYAMMFVISGLVGFSSGGILPLMGVLISTRFGAASFGLVVGLLNSAMIVGALAPWLAGFLRDVTGSYDMSWLLVIVFTVLTLPLVLALPKPASEQNVVLAGAATKGASV